MKYQSAMVPVKIGDDTYESQLEVAKLYKVSTATVHAYYQAGQMDMFDKKFRERALGKIEKKRVLNKSYRDKTWLDKPVEWRGHHFANIFDFCSQANVLPLVAKRHYSQHGSLDAIHPGAKSKYFDKVSMSDDTSFIAKAVRDYGVKPVARVLDISSRTVRERRSAGTLWQLAFPCYLTGNQYSEAHLREAVTEDWLLICLTTKPDTPEREAKLRAAGLL